MNTRLNAGRLRHRVTIQVPQHTQDPQTGEMVTTWASFAENIAAAIEPVSVREFVAAQAVQSRIEVRIVIRYRSGLNAAMRLVGSDGTIYNPQGFLPDADSGREYLTIPCSTC